MLDWMVEEGMAGDLDGPPYREFIEGLNLRFLTGIVTDPATLSEKIQIMAHIAAVLKEFTASKTKWEMYEGGQNRRLMWGIVSTPEDIARNPHLVARNWLTPVEHPEIGATLDYPGGPYRFSETPWAIHRRPPLVGEHNNEIFGGELRVSAEAWRGLEAKGVV
jgi:crotonobetainyl-CoA:carnitine CoA-transferase CaiB-like acyl-CoA transferase